MNTISVQEARALISGVIRPAAPATIPLSKAGGLTLATDVHANIDLPPFAQSNMDGYAIRFADRQMALEVKSTVPAGERASLPLARGTAARVFTGSCLPPGADTVVIQERVARKGNVIVADDPALTQGSHVRQQGSDMAAGEQLLPARTQLTPGAIALVAAAGIDRVPVFAVPSMSIIINGNEVIPPGRPLQDAQVYDATSFAINAALHAARLPAATVSYSEDRLETLATALQSALHTSELVLMAGGMSVGDFDLSVQALQQCGALIRFHGVRQRPGKPLLFATGGNRIVFGLPGNPSSALACFYLYVLPALVKMIDRPAQLFRQAQLSHGYQKPAGLTHFLRAQVDNGRVHIFSGQESYRLRAFANANCLVELAEERTNFEAGELVNIYLL